MTAIAALGRRGARRRIGGRTDAGHRCEWTSNGLVSRSRFRVLRGPSVTSSSTTRVLRRRQRGCAVKETHARRVANEATHDTCTRNTRQTGARPAE
ncbi:hypothetical protein XM57_25835 [Burkholderia cepacia]|nr:hypothetical protein XM57_25835 [Burkholderia cepacia]AYZ93673.1 hypothetical protein EGY28_00245 [Burkholderia dolosa]